MLVNVAEHVKTSTSVIFSNSVVQSVAKMARRKNGRYFKSPNLFLIIYIKLSQKFDV